MVSLLAGVRARLGEPPRGRDTRTYVRSDGVSSRACERGPHSLRRAALPLELQLPRRGIAPRGARRRGGPARPRGARPDGSRRAVRSGPFLRGGPGGGRAGGVRSRALAGLPLRPPAAPPF